MQQSVKYMVLSMCMLGLMVQAFTQESESSSEYIVHPRSKLVHDSSKFQSVQIVEGDDWVFEWKTQHERGFGNASLTPSSIVFQVDGSLEQFEWEGMDVKEHGGIYVQSCRCADRGIQFLEEGSISGVQRADKSWEVQLHAVTHGSQTGKRYEFRHTHAYKPIEE